MRTERCGQAYDSSDIHNPQSPLIFVEELPLHCYCIAGLLRRLGGGDAACHVFT